MSESTPIYIIYDHECPFCRTYCKYIRLKKTAGEVKLIDARKPSMLMDKITSLGLDIDRGMVVKINEKIYYGADAIHIIGLLSTRSGLFNRVNYWIFKSKKISSILYPILRDCRNLALRLMRVPFIRNLEKSE